MKHNLTFKREATKAKDGLDGFLYLHTWDTGYEPLIFHSHENADKFLDNINNQNIPELFKQNTNLNHENL